MKLIKEIADYQKLYEDLNNFATSHEYTVYKASSPNTEKVYYGYVTGTGDEAIRSEFTSQANRKGLGDDSRGIQQLVTAAGGDINDIEFEELAIVDTEDHAHALRDEERETDPESITGPSPLPAIIHRKAQENHPEIYARMARAREFNKLKNAREAWAAKYFDTNKIKTMAVDPKIKQELIKDLDVLSPREFSKKWNLPIEQPNNQ